MFASFSSSWYPFNHCKFKHYCQLFCAFNDFCVGGWGGVGVGGVHTFSFISLIPEVLHVSYSSLIIWFDVLQRVRCTLVDCLKQFIAAEHVENYRCSHCWHDAAIKYLSLMEGNEVIPAWIFYLFREIKAAEGWMDVGCWIMQLNAPYVVNSQYVICVPLLLRSHLKSLGDVLTKNYVIAKKFTILKNYLGQIGFHIRWSS